jgi:hypothetical protein
MLDSIRNQAIRMFEYRERRGIYRPVAGRKRKIEGVKGGGSNKVRRSSSPESGQFDSKLSPSHT